MKKSNYLKVVLSVATAMLISLGVSGQVANSNYVEYDANRLAPTNIDYVTLKAGGTTVGYYALPDPVYHPNYTLAGTWALTPGFTWTWTVLPAMTITQTGAANYAEITYTAAGNYAATVAENASAAYGSCADATPTVMNITVITPPTANITTADPAQLCGNQPAATVAIAFTEAAPAAFAAYAFAIHQTIENINAADLPIGAALVNADTLDYPTTGKLKAPTLTGGPSPYGYNFNTRAFRVLNGLRTRYTYTLVKASDAPGAAVNGVISAISQKSDFIGATVNTYPFGAKPTFVAIVNPAPATGPIYYIPNNFNF